MVIQFIKDIRELDPGLGGDPDLVVRNFTTCIASALELIMNIWWDVIRWKR